MCVRVFAHVCVCVVIQSAGWSRVSFIMVKEKQQIIELEAKVLYFLASSN